MYIKIKDLVEGKAFGRFILLIILLNAIVLGLETSTWLAANFSRPMEIINIVCIAIFVVEAILKLITWRGSYFKEGWNVFDFCIIILSLIPAGGVFSGIRVLRILRVLRSLRLVSGIKPLRKIVQAILESLPAIGWTGMLMLLLYYVYSIIGIHMYRDVAPDLFANFPESFVTLFSLTTMEGWQDVVFPFTDANPANWVYFLSFLIIGSFILLNLVVGIVVDNIDAVSRMDEEEDARKNPPSDLSVEIGKLREQLEYVEKLLKEHEKQ